MPGLVISHNSYQVLLVLQSCFVVDLLLAFLAVAIIVVVAVGGSAGTVAALLLPEWQWHLLNQTLFFNRPKSSRKFTKKSNLLMKGKLRITRRSRRKSSLRNNFLFTKLLNKKKCLFYSLLFLLFFVKFSKVSKISFSSSSLHVT
jgi:hypothetical protein